MNTVERFNVIVTYYANPELKDHLCDILEKIPQLIDRGWGLECNDGNIYMSASLASLKDAAVCAKSIVEFLWEFLYSDFVKTVLDELEYSYFFNGLLTGLDKDHNLFMNRLGTVYEDDCLTESMNVFIYKELKPDFSYTNSMIWF